MKICVYFTDMAALLQYQQQLAAQQQAQQQALIQAYVNQMVCSPTLHILSTSPAHKQK
jgi:hypothetical protein